MKKMTEKQSGIYERCLENGWNAFCYYSNKIFMCKGSSEICITSSGKFRQLTQKEKEETK